MFTFTPLCHSLYLTLAPYNAKTLYNVKTHVITIFIYELIKALSGSMNIISIKILAETKRWVYLISKEWHIRRNI